MTEPKAGWQLALEQIEQMPFSMVNDSESLRHTIRTIQGIARKAIAAAPSPPPSAAVTEGMVEQTARHLASWFGYEYDGLREGRLSKSYRQWKDATYQGGRQDLKDFALELLQAALAVAPQSKIGRYSADYSELSIDEIAQPDPPIDALFARSKPLPSAVAPQGHGGEGADEIGWIIERGDSSVAAPRYWHGSAWSPDHMLAIRFARQIDASRIARHLDPSVPIHRICEHQWSASRPAEPAPDAGRK
jgi:hypothetical protein